MTIQLLDLVLSGGVFVVLGAGLIWSVVGLVSGNRLDTLASVPVVPQQEITLASSGELLLALEVPRAASDFRGFQIELIEKQTGRAVTMTYSYVTAQGAVYGITEMKVPFGRIPAAHAGSYVARIAGMQPGKDYSSYRLTLSRPYMARMVGQILAIVFCGVGMLLSVIWAAWRAGLLKPG